MLSPSLYVESTYRIGKLGMCVCVYACVCLHMCMCTCRSQRLSVAWNSLCRPSQLINRPQVSSCLLPHCTWVFSGYVDMHACVCILMLAFLCNRTFEEARGQCRVSVFAFCLVGFCTCEASRPCRDSPFPSSCLAK